MKNNIKYGILSLTIISSLVLGGGYKVYANNPSGPDMRNENGGPFGIEEKGMDVPKLLGENKMPKIEGSEGAKNDFKLNREQYKIELEQMIQSIKTQRQEFKAEMETRREEAKTKMEQMREEFKASLKNVKDENKKITAEKIVDLIGELNTKITNNLSDKVDQIENVLVSIESRISKAKDKGIDVSSLDTKVSDAKEAITKAREAIKTQANKVYETTVTDDTTIKTEMKTLRDTFKKDIEAVRIIVKDAHIAVRNVAIALAQIPNINDVDSDESTDND